MVGNEDSAVEILIVHQVALQHGVLRTLEHLEVWPPSWASAGDNLRDALPINVAGRYVHAAGEARVAGQKLIDLIPITA